MIEKQKGRPAGSQGATEFFNGRGSLPFRRRRFKRHRAPVRLDDWRGLLLTTNFVDELEMRGWR